MVCIDPIQVNEKDCTTRDQIAPLLSAIPMRYAVRMSDIRIREASEADVSRILQLYRDAEIGTDQAFTAQEARAQLALFKRYPNFRVFVVESDGDIAGTYELLIMDNLAKRGKRSGIVEDVAVAPQHQGSGVGRAMMQHAMQECRTAGCYKLVLSSNLKRADAHAFYDALGFERHGYSFRVAIE